MAGRFRFDANPSINSATIHTLAAGDWIRKGAPLCLIGDSGTGQSHLLIGLGTAAAEKGDRVKYTLATRLVNELVEAADEKILAKPLLATAASTCSASTNSATWNSIAVVPNFSSRSSPKGDPRFCAAIVDRLTFNGAVIETGTDSHRPAHSLNRATSG